MDNIIGKIQHICRVCLMEDTLMFSVFHRSCTNQDISTMIMSCTSVKITQNDNLPQMLCSNCLDRLETAYLFKQECEKSEITLRKLLGKIEDSLDDNNEKNLDFMENIKTEPISEKELADQFSECDGINASTMVKVVMNVDENEVLELKNEESENCLETKSLRNRKVLRKDRKKNKTIKKLRKIVKNIEIDEKHPVFKCVVCDKDFRHHKRFWSHMNDHPNFTCYICWERFTSLEFLQDHNKDHPNQLYVCDQDTCDQQFEDCRSFVMHKKNEHDIKNYLQCSECEKTFSSHEKWDIHVHKHLRTRLFNCAICKKQFSQRASMESHMRIHEESFKCDMCDKSYTTIIKLERHKKTHDSNAFICEECGRKYNQRYNLKKHINVAHKGIKPPKKLKTHLCPHCGQTFSRPVDLTTHIRIHTGVKPFSCEKCDYRCHDKQLLKSHDRIHTGLRPYKCNFCEKSFGSRSYLTIHRRFHTGYRPYICGQCQKGFTNSKDLKVHERTHTGIKLYHCNICNNSFTTLHYLKVHTKKHEVQ